MPRLTSREVCCHLLREEYSTGTMMYSDTDLNVCGVDNLFLNLFDLEGIKLEISHLQAIKIDQTIFYLN